MIKTILSYNKKKRQCLWISGSADVITKDKSNLNVTVDNIEGN